MRAIEQILHASRQDPNHLLSHLFIKVFQLAFDNLQLLGIIATRIIVQVTKLRVEGNPEERKELSRALVTHDPDH